ncbi:MAG: sensor histidine kinase [Anaeromicrobium sp.]|uniref:sensor histidine kinase n=1 Tax=Anaeromicrobium sp. TaxID=1929132 RepID=UPI0025D35B2E|nr:sensor histidine kinase [Anaeromicrobium sp.]MCT4594999.1 sensor histidine kinase [Anaeromicrobium sp.]
MDIRWKNIIYRRFIKGVSFLLGVVFSVIIIGHLVELSSMEDMDGDLILNGDYKRSYELETQLNNMSYYLTNILSKYKGEEHIKSGGTLKGHDYNYEIRNLYRDFKEKFYEESKLKKEEIKEEDVKKAFEEEYLSKIQVWKDKRINEDLRTYNEWIKEIDSIDGLYYFISDGGYVKANSENKSKEFFKSQPVYIIYDESEQDISIEDSHIIESMNRRLENYNNEIIYIGLNEEFVNLKEESWNRRRRFLLFHLKIIIGAGIGLMITLIHLMYTCGRKEKDGPLNMTLIDKPYLDLNLIISGTIIMACLGGTYLAYRESYPMFMIPLATMASIIGIYLILTITKHIKNRTLISHTLIYKIIRKIFSSIGNGLKRSPLAIRMIPTPKQVRDLEMIITGIKSIEKGQLNYEIKTESNGVYKELGDGINGVTKGLKVAIEKELKSERLKTELISNVSHDIRTPLTSIITYIDLLKKEEVDSENIKKYLKILEEKSLRLKVLTDDLFEASKASSGSIPVNFEKIDIISLLTQVMGELDNKINSSGLDFKLNYPEEKVFVKGDGRLLWRIIENLMSNIFKYALMNSRVYIDVIDLGNSISIVMKNISAYELNIDANELMERFKRADESRNSEGSGLGLSIAKSLVELQKGSFNIDIDGDLFKAIVTIPKH